MLINHILSSDTKSAIFDAIFDYFARYSPRDVHFSVTVRPLSTADVHHYHRPHLERALRDRSIVTVHHDLFDPDPWLDRDTFLKRYREAQTVVCLNRGQQSFLRDMGISHTRVIPHGYNDEVLHPKAGPPRLGHPDRKVTLGFFSKYYERRFKGEAYFHELAKRLSPDSFAFVLVGERRLPTAEALIGLGFETMVYDYLPYRTFQSLYESVDYLLMCSNFEGGPANLPEAMATETPILATPVGFAPDFIEDEQNGLLLTGDADEDAARITRLAGPDDPLAATLESNARALRERVPSWRDVVQQYVALYQTIGG